MEDLVPERGSAARHATIASDVVRGERRQERRGVEAAAHPMLHVAHRGVAGRRRDAHARLLRLRPSHVRHHVPRQYPPLITRHLHTHHEHIPTLIITFPHKQQHSSIPEQSVACTWHSHV